MKNALIVPLRFLLVLISIFIVLSVLISLSMWGSNYDPASEQPMRSIFELVPLFAFKVFPISVILSVVISLFFILRKVLKPFIPLLIIFVLSSALLFFGMYFFLNISSDQSKAAKSTECTIPENVFTDTDGAIVYFQEEDPYGLRNTVVLIQDREPGFVFTASAELSRASDELFLPSSGERLSFQTAGKGFCELFVLPGFVDNLKNDILIFNERLVKPESVFSLEYVIECLTLTLFFVSLWLFVRATRWPLFNAVLVIVLVRIFFLLHIALQGELIIELAGRYVKDPVLEFVPVLFFILLTCVFLLANLVTKPFSEWKKEVSHEYSQ